MGAYLVEIHTQEENDWLKEKLVQMGKAASRNGNTDYLID
jgi:hypothetical protein